MPRLGEAHLAVQGTTIGAFWVESVYANSGFAPRLGLRIGCQLLNFPKDSLGRREGTIEYRIVDVRFQLHWQSESGPEIGNPAYSGGSRDLRSADYGPDYQLNLVCPLNILTLERIEEERAGAPPFMALEVWPTLISSGGELMQGHVQAIRFEVPREMWLDFLAKSGYADFDVLEIRKIGTLGGSLTEAVRYTREAREIIHRGDANQAVALCRKALEAAAISGGGDLKETLAAAYDDRRADQYTRIIAALKQLAALKMHHYGSDVSFSRSEALFTVRMTEGVLVLLSSAPQQAGDQESSGESSSVLS